MFMDRLNTLSNVEGHMELFLDHKRFKPALAGYNDFPRYYEWKSDNTSIRPFSVWKYLSTLYSTNAVVGFKLMYSHLRIYPEIIPYIYLKRIKIIHLIRDNYLDIIISEKIAELTGKSHTTSDNEINSDLIYLDPEKTLSRIKQLESNTRKIKNIIKKLYGIKSIEVHYDDLNSNPEYVFDAVKYFLNLDKSIKLADSNLRKRQTRTKSEVIKNYDELSSHLSVSGYKHLLHN